ncbi:MAG: adenylate kinase [Synechococcales cyanobacterium]
MRLIFLGAPGSGKTTHAKKLAADYQLPYIGTGEMLLEDIAQATPLGVQAQAFVEQGKLVPDTLMIDMIRERLRQSDTRQGWILDGYPRTAFQAEELDILFMREKHQVNYAIWLQVSADVLWERSQLRGRLDDQPEALQERLLAFENATKPLLEYYAVQQKLVIVLAERDPDSIQDEIRQRLGLI